MVKHTTLLAISTLLSVLLFTIHVADDIVRGFEKGGVYNLTSIPIFTLWLSGAVLLSGRRSGYIITTLGSVLGLAAPILHMSGKGVGGEFAKTDGAFFFIVTILALGVSALFSLVLSIHGLWSLRRGGRW